MSYPVKKFIVSCLLCLGSSLATAADSKGIKTANLKGADLDLMNNHDPASELANFEFLPGYQANLFAADPMLANPIHMHWDSRGRLWVACSWTYPQIKPGAVADDKIIILEDTDNDGRADKSTVFADGLYLPTGIELANGGCYVGQSPDVFFLKDIDGDDVADVKELALTGFGIEDSHHSISAWRRGPGGWIYFQEGIFLHSQIETQYGVIKNFNGGVYQFNPRTQELRVFCTGTGGNPWGHVFDKWGQSFMVNNPRIMYLSPSTGNSGEKVQVKPLISTEKQCGGDLASGTHVCDDIRGNLMSGRFKSRAVIRYEFIENGAGFSARVLEPLMTSKHPNFRPVDVKMGPDGAVYVADWYNSIINHAQHDFRDPRRDHDHGRIWRITHKERPLVEKPALKGISISELVSHLGSQEAFVRSQTRNELTEHDADQVLAALESWVEQLDQTDPNYDLQLVEAMWACQNVEQVSEAILSKVLNAKSGNARSAGARVLRYWYQELSDPVAMIAKAAADPFPRTRMEAVLSAGFIPKAEAFAAALHVTDHPGDQFLDQALPQTQKALESYWRPAMEAGTLTFAKDSHREYLEQKAGIGFDKRFAEFLEQGGTGSIQPDAILKQFVAVATEREMRLAVDTLIGKNGEPSDDLSIALLQALKSIPAKGAATPKRMNRVISNFRRILDHKNDTIVRLAIDNFGEWKAIKVDAPLLAILKSETRSIEVRQAASLALAKLGGHLEELSTLANSREIENRYAAVPGLVYSDLENGVVAAAELLKEDPGEHDPVGLIQQILTNRKGNKLLTAGLKGLTLHPKVVERVSAFHRTTGQLPKSLSGYFQSSSGSLSALLLAEDQDGLTADVVELGDAHRGETIYRRKAIACTNCHAIGSAGPAIGPNLVAVGAAATAEYMVESILEPNAAIAEHYENRLFTLKDGTVRMGVITFKSEKEVVVRDSAQAGKEVTLQAVNILKEQAVPSLMPAGLADQLNDRQEFLDLAKFLSELGRPGDFANDESPVLRKWRIASATDQRPPNQVSGWLPAYSKVNGELPDSDIAPFGDQVFVRSFVDVLSEGELLLDINDTAGLRLWVNEKEVSEPTKAISLLKGKVTMTFTVDRSKRETNGIRVELKAPASSAIKFQPEGGM